MMKHKIIPLLLALLLLSGCTSGGGASSSPPSQNAAVTEPPAPEAVEVYVSAAASLTDVLTELANLYHTVDPEVKLTFSFDSSGTLQTQIEEGAPADLFLSAAQRQMDALEDGGLIDPESRVDLLENKVVLIVPRSAQTELSGFEEVATDQVSMVALGEASVPVGQYAQEIYEALGLWAQVSAKANFGTNVRTVLAWVESGEVDCGVVYATDAAVSDGVKVVCTAPEGCHKPVVYPAAVLVNAKHPQQARRFLSFLRTDTAQAVFERYGFTMAV